MILHLLPMLLPGLLASQLACTGAPAGDSGGLAGGTPGALKPALLPFPSAHLVDSDGFLDLPDDMPMAVDGTPFPVERLAWRTGFSVVQTTVIDPEVPLDPDSLPGPEDVARADASVQLWDLTAGERLPAFAELDAWCEDNATDPDADADPACEDAVPALLVRPLAPMPAGHRVAVAVTTDVRTTGGTPWSGPQWYFDLQAGNPGAWLLGWEEHYAELQDELEALGVTGLAFAVDFPVGDGTAPTRAMAEAVSTPTEWTWTRSEDVDAGDSLPPRTWRQAEGSFTADTWLVDDSTLSLDAAGLPAAQGQAQVDLFVHVPDSVRDAEPGTAPVWIFGHGIFSDPGDYLAEDDDPSAMLELADRAGAIVVATTWRGLTYRDLPTALNVGNDFGRIPELTDKLAQGVINAVALRRLVTDGGLLDDPVFDGRADPDTLRYHGISLGGIEGATFLALDPAVPHGVFHVGGSSWSTMLERSANWPQFELLVSYGVPDPLDRQVLYAASQLFWDQADPAGYVDDLAGRSVLWQESMGDEQVPNITTHAIARGAGATLLAPAVEQVWGLETADGPLTGPALSQFDPELGRPTQWNRPAPVTGAHGAPRHWHGVQDQTLRFLDPDDPGVVVHYCGDGPCTASNASTDADADTSDASETSEE